MTWGIAPRQSNEPPANKILPLDTLVSYTFATTEPGMFSATYLVLLV